MSLPTYRRGFTLSELLVSLSILGLIAALTLPSIFNSVSTQKKHAVFKETIQIVQNTFYKGFMEGGITDNGGTSTQNYFKNSVNHTKWEDDCTVPHYTDNKPCMYLSSGAVIIFFTYVGFFVDWNGLEGINRPLP